MNMSTAERVIENVHGLDDESTGAGEAWAFVKAEIARLNSSLSAEKKEVRRAVGALIEQENETNHYKAALKKIKDMPLTVAGTQDVIDACSDLHTIITSIAHHALNYDAEEHENPCTSNGGQFGLGA